MGTSSFRSSDVHATADARDEDLVALDEALSRLEQIDARASRVVELRFFTGLSERETAEALEISISTLKRDWNFAKAWLFDQLSCSYRGIDLLSLSPSSAAANAASVPNRRSAAHHRIVAPFIRRFTRPSAILTSWLRAGGETAVQLSYSGIDHDTV